MLKKFSFIVGSLIIVIVASNMIGQIYQAVKSGDRFSNELEKLRTLEIKNEELKSQLKLVKTFSFIEQQARDKLGLVKEGETVVVIPTERISQVLGMQQEGNIEVKLPNWLGWLKLFF